MALKRWDLSKQGEQWLARDPQGETQAWASTKKEAVRRAGKAARTSGEPISLRIHDLDGRLQDERTYPRRADPRSSEG